MIPVPLNHLNLSDERSYQIAVSMIPAEKKERKGALFINPGGPGGSGTAMIQGTRGPALWKVLKGQYDIVGFDPRGINKTVPGIRCFDTLAEQYVLNAAQSYYLDIPANLSLLHPYHLDSQLGSLRAGLTSVAKKCKEVHGDYLRYLGTADVVRDIEWMATAIDGEDAKVNFWGVSYGTIIGQYLVQILKPSRIGHIFIDGVVDPEKWADYSIEEVTDGIEDVDHVFRAFASSCLSAGPSLCPLAVHFSTSAKLLEAMDALLDSLYRSPQPASSKQVPSLTYHAAQVRKAYFRTTYSIAQWNASSHALDKALFPRNGEEALQSLVEMFADGLPANISLFNATTMPGDTLFAGLAIACADSKPYDAQRPAPTTEEFARYLLKVVKMYSPRTGDGFHLMAHCDTWDVSWQHRYPGPFGIPNGTLEMPIIIASQHFDPSTPLIAAKRAFERLGSNARLVEQVDGWGHCAVSQTSYCTAKIMQDYFTKDVLPDSYTACKVDRKPWLPWNETQAVAGLKADVSLSLLEDEEEMIQLLSNWVALGEEVERWPF
ncbi:hypothetical protein BT69DRAFT_348667 [Atractiella rhizophila]|nr:hypothetical protein BT69DRAFT_348667 [Atractiella rhizophila]